MSIVGTRPPLISETNLYEPHHKVTVSVQRAGKSVRLRPTCNFDVFDI